ncbi:uncharacterized protein LOC130644790 [Hydractinia symbiolongicarpus]|uniref:uncharacterized protein LOC130644790 n=1 Tax=Hydractinia symbiolongicarpus TaxID=13093 RepID=UPI00254EB2FC|nr:uncharacterized protein LOC130644790 [Hydractinia symbiolongicarpus]
MGSNKKPVIYYENWILKKEGVKTWVSYWAVIRGKWLQFFEKISNTDKLELRKTLELTKKVQCSLVKRNKKRFPFSLNNGLGVYYIKCESELERYHWIFSILTASLEKPKTELPPKVPISMAEIVAFEKGKTKENSTPKNSPTKVPTAAADIHNKRRQKYAIRSENRQKRKAAKRAKQLGLDVENATNNNETGLYKTASSAELRRTQKIKLNEADELKKYRSLEVLKENSKKTTLPQLAREVRKDCTIRERSNSFEVKAIVHSPTKISMMGDQNFAYEDEEEDDIAVHRHIPIVLNDEQLLPNMIISEVSDSESDVDSENTAETSINSRNSFFSSSNTFISTVDDDEWVQNGSRGRPDSSSNIPGTKDSLTVGPLSEQRRPLSTGSLSPKRPLTPNRSRPTTPKSPAHFSRFMINDATFSNA